MGTEFNFKSWASESGLTTETVKLLEEQALTCDRGLRAVKDSELEALELPLGQRVLLREAASSLRPQQAQATPTAASQMTEQSSAEKSTLRNLATDSELNELVRQLGDCHLKDLLAMNQSGNADHGSLVTGKGERPLLIPDFVKLPKGVYNEDYDEVLAGNFTLSSQLVVRTKKKPSVEQVSLAQWIGASCRILLRLIEQDKASPAMIKDYLEYCAEVGDLCQTYTTTSVMLLDNAHRIMQTKNHCSWKDTDMHSRNFYLEKKPAHPTTQKPTANRNIPAQGKRNRPVDAQGRQICISYNQPSGCPYPSCKFQHVCTASGCGGSHPQHQHDTLPPRFRDK